MSMKRLEYVAAVSGRIARRQAYLKSSAVTGSPLLNFSPARRLKTYRVPSSETSHDSAAAGPTEPSGMIVANVSYRARDARRSCR